MTEEEFAAWLVEAVQWGHPSLPSDQSRAVVHLDSFSDVGILTDNTGLVFGFLDGSEFEVTIVRNNPPDENES